MVTNSILDVRKFTKGIATEVSSEKFRSPAKPRDGKVRQRVLIDVTRYCPSPSSHVLGLASFLGVALPTLLYLPEATS